TDGLIVLRPLTAADAGAHLAGEDDAIARWLSGGRSSLETVQAYIADCRHNWRNDGPRRAFGIFHSDTGALMGSIEASFAFRSRAVTPLAPGQVNLSIGIFADWRRQGIANRALRLMAQYLATNTDAREMILRIVPEN